MSDQEMPPQGRQPEHKPLIKMLYEDMAEKAYERGSGDFEAFALQAAGSHVPVEFQAAMANQIDTMTPRMNADLASGAPSADYYPRLAEKLFERQAMSPDDAEYGIHYAHAVSTVKTWDQMRQELDQANQGIQGPLQQLATMLGCKPEEVLAKLKEPSYASLKGLVGNLEENMQKHDAAAQTGENLRRLAVQQFGFMGLTSDRIIASSGATPLRQVNRFIKELAGDSIPGHLKEVESGIEHYFSNPANQKRMVHLAQPRRR